MTTISPMEGIFNRLSDLGISPEYVKRMALPEWWDDEVASTPLGFAQAAGYIGSKLGLDIGSLLENGPIRRIPHQIAFKKPKDATAKRLEIEGAIAAQTAQIAIEATPEARNSMPESALEWRERLLDSSEKITFEALLTECWSCGIAVLSLTGEALPTGRRGRPHALAAHFDGHFAIVLMGEKQHENTPWQLFRLAHEVAHITLGHLQVDDVIFDEKIFSNERDPQEVEADAFAVELLFGTGEMKFKTAGKQWLSAGDLAQAMPSFSETFRVEAGVIALNWARTMTEQGCGANCWATANSALRKHDSSNAHELVRCQLEDNLEWEELSHEQAAFLRRANSLQAAAPLSSRPREVELAA